MSTFLFWFDIIGYVISFSCGAKYLFLGETEKALLWFIFMQTIGILFYLKRMIERIEKLFIGRL